MKHAFKHDKCLACLSEEEHVQNKSNFYWELTIRQSRWPLHLSPLDNDSNQHKIREKHDSLLDRELNTSRTGDVTVLENNVELLKQVVPILHIPELVLTKNTPALFTKGLILLDVKQCDAIKHKGKESFFLFGGEGGGGGESGNAEQHYVLFKELKPHLGLSLTSSGA